MAKKEGLRVEKYSSVSTTTPVKIAEKNPARYKLKLRPTGANGCIIGLDVAVEGDTCYFVPQNEEVEIERYKGEVYALSVTTAADLYVIEEDE